MKQKVIAVIPARYASVRFPGKILAPILGKPLIEWVWRGVSESKMIDEVIVATDDKRIADTVQKLGGKVKMTNPDLPSGTDRVAEAVKDIQVDWIINVQGDEPLISGKVLDDFISQISENAQMATLARKMEPGTETNPNIVKVVSNIKGEALYFSRSPIPYHREEGDGEYWQHLGIYAYRFDILKSLISLPVSKLEKTEKLEQLRALQNGIAIQVIPTNLKSVGVDTPQDIEKVETILSKKD